MSSNKELTKRSLSFGANSLFITILVIGLVGVFNFLSYQYPKKLDLTKNKLHTFSEQSENVIKGLKSDLKAEFFGDIGAKEKHRTLFDNYKKLSPKFKFELVDPNKEVMRAKSAGIKKPETLVLTYNGKTLMVDEITEEKITNAAIKITKDGKTTVCTVVGHGENSINDQNANGLMGVKKGLENQAYDVKEIILAQEPKVPADCSVLVMLGANKALFPTEIKALGEYLDNGGRAVIALETSIGQPDQTKEIRELLKTWGVDVKTGLIIDPISRQLGVDASVPIIVQFNSEQAITKNFAQQCYFPFSRPVDPVSPEPVGIKTAWIAKTTPKAWSETDMASITKGAVQFNPNGDVPGPLNTVVTADGKKVDSKASRNTRLVVFGSSQFANNQYSRFGGNMDLLLNSVSWTLEDENLISIRGKEAEEGKIELSQNEGTIIFWISVVFVPLFIAAFGIVIWVRRKKL
jgi:ABC-type uncharacterized transport system involved in gliding motility auxiliary subunit